MFRGMFKLTNLSCVVITIVRPSVVKSGLDSCLSSANFEAF